MGDCWPMMLAGSFKFIRNSAICMYDVIVVIFQSFFRTDDTTMDNKKLETLYALL